MSLDLILEVKMGSWNSKFQLITVPEVKTAPLWLACPRTGWGFKAFGEDVKEPPLLIWLL